MRLKLLTAALAISLAGESLLIFVYRHPANRFKPVDGYQGAVAFDTATGQLCKTLRTKTAAQIAEQAKADFAKELAESAKREEFERDEAARTHNQLDQTLAEIYAVGPQASKDTSALEFIAVLPGCKDIR